MPLAESACQLWAQMDLSRSRCYGEGCVAHPGVCCQVLNNKFTICGSDASGYKQGVTVSIIPSGWLCFSWQVEGKKAKLLRS